jgi:hypothetical protein
MLTYKSRRPSRRAVLTLIGSGIAAHRASAQSPAAAAASPRVAPPIEIEARRIDNFSRTSSETRFGRLSFRGGLVLTSNEKSFGGWSGLCLEPDGRRLFAVSDDGHWLSGEIAYAGTAPSGITHARFGTISASSGRELTRKRDADSEAVALLEGNLTRGTVLISFERLHRIGRFPIVDGVLLPPAGYLRMPAESKQMSANKGIEAVAVLAGGPLKGSIVAISERFPHAGGHHVGWIWVNGEPRRFEMTDVGGFDVTDLAALPDGTLLVLERRFRWTEGVKMQLRQIKPAELVPGQVIVGEILLSADMGSEIDNLEGLAVSRSARGEVVLTMISDDNFNSLLQRTILLQFTLS